MALPLTELHLELALVYAAERMKPLERETKNHESELNRKLRLD